MKTLSPKAELVRLALIDFSSPLVQGYVEAMAASFVCERAALPADNDHAGVCKHCGRDNSDHVGEPCIDDCPSRAFIFSDLAPETLSPKAELVRLALIDFSKEVKSRLDVMLDDGIQTIICDNDRLEKLAGALAYNDF